MDIKKRESGRPVGSVKRRIEISLTQDTIEHIDRLKGPIDRSAWITMVVAALGSDDPQNGLAALLKATKQ